MLIILNCTHTHAHTFSHECAHADKVNKFKRNFSALSASDKSALSVFGEDVEYFANFVEGNIQKFGNQPPIGPLGKYIKLKEDKWKYALADCVNIRSCQTYICAGKKEVEILDKLLRCVCVCVCLSEYMSLSVSE
jgi:hypothetical protein